MNRLEEIGALINRIWSFDHHYMYSDDHSVWRRGEEAKANLRKYIAEMTLKEEEILLIMEEIGRRSDERYLDARAKYTSVAISPLWNEGDGPELKRMVKGLFS